MKLNYHNYQLLQHFKNSPLVIMIRFLLTLTPPQPKSKIYPKSKNKECHRYYSLSDPFKLFVIGSKGQCLRIATHYTNHLTRGQVPMDSMYTLVPVMVKKNSRNGIYLSQLKFSSFHKFLGFRTGRN